MLVIAFVTLSPIGLRPEWGSDVFLQRFAAYVVLGAMFGLAYPDRTWTVLFLVVGAAGGLEFLQLLTPDRHGHLPDMLSKALGGASGVAMSDLALQSFARMQAGTPPK